MKTAGPLIAFFLVAVNPLISSCGDEGEKQSAGCAQRDLDVCEEARTQCDLDAETADSPSAARKKCTADWCTCIEAAGCDLENYRECTPQ
jgi:hypothetical protein